MLAFMLIEGEIDHIDWRLRWGSRKRAICCTFTVHHVRNCNWFYCFVSHLSPLNLQFDHYHWPKRECRVWYLLGRLFQTPQHWESHFHLKAFNSLKLWFPGIVKSLYITFCIGKRLAYISIQVLSKKYLKQPEVAFRVEHPPHVMANGFIAIVDNGLKHWSFGSTITTLAHCIYKVGPLLMSQASISDSIVENIGDGWPVVCTFNSRACCGCFLSRSHVSVFGRWLRF